MKQFLVREPSRTLASGIVTYISRVPVDTARATRQWKTYLDTMTTHGWSPVLVPLAAPCADGVFIEDPVFMYKDIAVLTRPATLSRRFEMVGIQDTVESLGYRVHKIEAPGTLEGGDLLVVGDDVFVGYGGRSNAHGIRQLREILRPTGAKITAVPMGPALHLKSAVTALPDGSFIGYPPALAEVDVFPRFHPVPELQGSNVVVLAEDKVLIAANCRGSAALIAELGFDVVPVNISEFQKLEGDVTCLSVRLPPRSSADVSDSPFARSASSA